MRGGVGLSSSAREGRRRLMVFKARFNYRQVLVRKYLMKRSMFCMCKQMYILALFPKECNFKIVLCSSISILSNYR